MDTMTHLPADAFSSAQALELLHLLPNISPTLRTGDSSPRCAISATPYPRRSGAGRGHFPLLRPVSTLGTPLAVAYERDCLTGGGQELLSNASASICI